MQSTTTCFAISVDNPEIEVLPEETTLFDAAKLAHERCRFLCVDGQRTVLTNGLLPGFTLLVVRARDWEGAPCAN